MTILRDACNQTRNDYTRPVKRLSPRADRGLFESYVGKKREVVDLEEVFDF